MHNPLLIRLLVAGFIGGFCTWLSIKMLDSENPKNKFLYAFLVNLIFGLVATYSIYGFLATLFILAVFGFTLYELKPAQVIGMVIIIVILYAIIGGILWLMKGILPDSIRPYLVR